MSNSVIEQYETQTFLKKALKRENDLHASEARLQTDIIAQKPPKYTISSVLEDFSFMLSSSVFNR